MNKEKDLRWGVGLPLIVAGVVLLVFGTLLMVSGSLSPIASVKLTAQRSLVLPFAVSRWFDVLGWTMWVSFLVNFFVRLKKERRAGDPWLVGVGFIAFAAPGAGLYFVCGLAGLLVLAAVSGAVLGLMLGIVMRSDDPATFFRGWYQDGGIVVGPGLGIGISFVCGTAVGLAFGILTGLIASLAYGAMLLVTFGIRWLVRSK